ncbi:MAG TPA: type II toxin-antitoxin system Phd/YefM family antitoxin [Gammaproteobacteria bacterium]|nr:type II toxin-antitoxin system Phd/YefM family antitoxin [Gammaproteobacteria bacterium]
MKDSTWQLQEAKSKFSQLVERAMREEPQIVTKHGNKAVVVLSFEEYAKLTRPKTSLVEFLRTSPLAEAGLDITRNKETPREIDL